jgi:GDP-4-dehydro-6-deoxy-D-mannose reductase
MRTLVTGVDGFIGRWLARALLASDDRVDGLSRRGEGQSPDGVTRHLCDITQTEAVAHLVDELKPDRIFHLAALNNIGDSFADPRKTFRVNVGGSLNVLEAVRMHAPDAVLLSVGSSAEYGTTATQAAALSENLPLWPSSPYGLTKAAQGMLVQLYARAHGVKALHVRPFAIVGPGKSGDALADLCQAIVGVEEGYTSEVQVGNLDVMRDFVDVRDCVRALLLLSTEGQAGEVYNLCNGRAEGLRSVIAILESCALKPFRVIQSEGKLRSSDDVRIIGNGRKLAALGYSPRHTLSETVQETLGFWRRRPFNRD